MIPLLSQGAGGTVTDIVAWLPDVAASRQIGEIPARVAVADPSVTALEDSGAQFVVLLPEPPRELLATVSRLPEIRVLQLMSSGVEHALPYRPPNAVLCSARGTHDAPVAEWVLLAVLAGLRSLPDYVRRQPLGSWTQTTGTTLRGKRVLIVGYGSIGRAVEERLAGFDVEVVRVGRRVRPGVHPITDLDALLPAADVVVLLLPGGDETYRLFGAPRLDRLRDGALLVNAGRGSVVDTDALLGPVRDGRLRVALDVVDPEPLPPDHPLWQLPGALITPHVASDVDSRVATAYAFVGRQLRRFAAGDPLENVVAP